MTRVHCLAALYSLWAENITNQDVSAFHRAATRPRLPECLTILNWGLYWLYKAERCESLTSPSHPAKPGVEPPSLLTVMPAGVAAVRPRPVWPAHLARVMRDAWVISHTNHASVRSPTRLHGCCSCPVDWRDVAAVALLLSAAIQPTIYTNTQHSQQGIIYYLFT